jgi:hypothetical protein
MPVQARKLSEGIRDGGIGGGRVEGEGKGLLVLRALRVWDLHYIF